MKRLPYYVATRRPSALTDPDPFGAPAKRAKRPITQNLRPRRKTTR